jgi:hypothetical protein
LRTAPNRAYHAAESAGTSSIWGMPEQGEDVAMATVADGMGWFNQNFGAAVTAALGGTGYSLDFLTAIAVQETFEVWASLFRTMPPVQVLQLWVGDTLDAPNRSAFPTSKAELVAARQGQAIFQAARQALEQMAEHINSYQGAVRNPDKFCHGFGIFQYDIQFCTEDPAFFLERRWFDFGACLSKALTELNEAKRRAYGPGKNQLTHDEMVYVAIAYNTGRVNTQGSFKQGFFDHDSGKFYGELIADYMATARNVFSATA